MSDVALPEKVIPARTSAVSEFLQDRLGVLSLCILAFYVLVAVFAPVIAPYDPMATNYTPSGTVVRMQPPSAAHLFGTNRLGRDIFSQVVWGARVALLIGVLSAVIVVVIGLNVGLISGYFGGRVDNVLMRLTDLTFGLPYLPFAIILVTVLGTGIDKIIIVIAVGLWPNTARVIRSQVLSLKVRAFVDAARITGVSHAGIIYRHITPNVLPIAFVYVPLTMGIAISTEAGLSFLGYGDAELMSWGRTLHEVWMAQAVYQAWWWTVFPGLAILGLVLSGFMLGRALEQFVNPKLRGR
jgi:peptide/nickel transport system permease protein